MKSTEESDHGGEPTAAMPDGARAEQALAALFEMPATAQLSEVARRVVALSADLFGAPARLELDLASPRAGAHAFTHPETEAAAAALSHGSVLELPLVARGRGLGRLTISIASRPQEARAEPWLGPWLRQVASTLEAFAQEERLGAQEERLGEQAERLRALEVGEQVIHERLNEFVARLGHDLRAPLGAVLMWTHVAREAVGSLERTAALEAIELGAREQNAVIAELVDLARARAGRLVLARTRFAAREIVEGALDAIRADTRKRGGRIDWAPADPPSSQPEVEGDLPRLIRSLSNLVLHAFRLSEPGSAVTIVTAREPGWIRLEVRAGFEGLAPSALERHLARFDFASFDAAAGLGGAAAGFGVAYAREIAEQHGATLTVEAGSSSPSRPSPTAAALVLRLPVAD
jgi:signal transduction histidine kinase